MWRTCSQDFFSKRKSIFSSERAVNTDLGHVCKWIWTNPLTLNVSKSKFLSIGSSFRLSKVGSIHISADDTPLDNVDSYTYLGIVINSRFSWSDHIESVRSNISKKLGLLRRIKSCLPLSTRVTFYSFILPLFDDGDIIWGDRSNATLLSELQLLQNKAARLVLDLPAHLSAP